MSIEQVIEDITQDRPLKDSELKREMLQAIQRAKGRIISYIAAKKFSVGSKTMSLFLVDRDVKRIKELFELSKKGTAAHLQSAKWARGTCEVSEEGNRLRVYIRSVEGKLDEAAVATAVGQALQDDEAALLPGAAGPKARPQAPPAVGTSSNPRKPDQPEQAPAIGARADLGIAGDADPARVAARDAARRQADAEQAAWEQAGAKKLTKTAIERAEESARLAETGGNARSFQLDPKARDASLKTVVEMTEYVKFHHAFQKFAKKWNLALDQQKVPVKIWVSLLKQMEASGYLDAKVPKANGRNIFGRIDGATGKVVREELLRRGIEGLKVFADHAATYLDKVVAETQKGSRWAFWSGDGAKESALAECTGGVVLEGTVGAWFDKVQFPKVTSSINSMVFWTSVSEMYAKKAAEHYQHFKFVGYVGPRASTEQSVFNQVEQPSFIEVFDQRQQVVPEVEWYVAACEPKVPGDPSKGWVWTKGAPATYFGKDRNAAIAEVKRRYGR